MREFFLTTERLGFSVWKEEDIGDALELWGQSRSDKIYCSRRKNVRSTGAGKT